MCIFRLSRRGWEYALQVALEMFAKLRSFSPLEPVLFAINAKLELKSASSAGSQSSSPFYCFPSVHVKFAFDAWIVHNVHMFASQHQHVRDM